MKIFFLAFAIISSSIIHAQTVTDSVNTSIGDFVLVTSESIESSQVYSEETITTSDGGSGAFVAVSSNARFMLQPATGSALQISLLPNPTAGTTELKVIGMSGSAAIIVTNVLGQVVYSSNQNIDSVKQIFLPSQLWESGTYLVVVNNGQEVKSERLIVQ